MKSRTHCDVLLFTAALLYLLTGTQGLSAKFLGYGDIPKQVEATRSRSSYRLGGLSGVTWDEERQMLLAISDKHPYLTAFLDLNISQINEEHPGESSLPVAAVNAMTLTSTLNAPFAEFSLDPEDLEYAPGGKWLVWCDEEQSRIFISSATDHSFQEHTLWWPPDDYESRRGQGIEPNAGFESVMISIDGKSIWTATEQPLLQDLMIAGPFVSRLLEYDIAGNPRRQLAFQLEYSPMVHGLSGMVAINMTHFLAIERAYSLQYGVSVKVSLCSMVGATDISTWNPAVNGTLAAAVREQQITTVSKHLLVDMAYEESVWSVLDNIEGGTFLPKQRWRHPERPLIVFISDDNFNPAQHSRLYLFELEGVVPEPMTSSPWPTPKVQVLPSATPSPSAPPTFPDYGSDSPFGLVFSAVLGCLALAVVAGLIFLLCRYWRKTRLRRSEAQEAQELVDVFDVGSSGEEETL